MEQYSGGGWGTRDVCQGPVELLLALGRFEPVRDLLVRVFKTQNPDGDWPQWFMFFERERHIRPAIPTVTSCCGRCWPWPNTWWLARMQRSWRKSCRSFMPRATHRRNVGRSVSMSNGRLAVIRNRLIPGTHLAAYGYGDWNDSLQPADPSMRERLCSAWTVTLHYQTLTALAAAFRRLAWPEPAAHYEAMAAQVREDFQRLLVYAAYGRALHGDIPLDGGWRIYSSGAGIGMSLILRCFLGMRREQRLLVIDPVIPASLDGLQVELELAGRAFEVIYRIAGAGCGPTAVNLNGADLPFSRGANLYRIGAAAVPMEAVLARLMDGVNRLCIQVG